MMLVVPLTAFGRAGHMSISSADGVLRVIELGDGQVSDRAATTSAHALVAAILAGLNSDP